MNHQMDEDLKDLPKLQEEEGEKLKRSTSSSIPRGELDADHHDRDEMMEEGEIFDEDKALEGSYKCNICKKTFKNSQALGGHRRSHILQALKKKSMTHFSNFSKQGTPRANFNDNDFDDHEKTICYICNKKFPSKNALSGHMKCHPNRVSKAFSFSPISQHHHHHHQNSSSSNNSNSSLDQDDGFVAENEKKNSDLQKSPLPKWKNKNRRGKRRGAMCMAAKILMTMPKDKNFYPEVLLPIKKRKLEIGESSKGKELKPVNRIRIVYNGLMMFGKKNDVADGSGGSGSSGSSESRADENKVMKKKSKKKTEESAKSYDPDLGGYKCNLCGKCFSTFQGLGGHKSSHSKYDTSISIHESNNSDVVPVADVQENNSSSSNAVVVVVKAQENNSSCTNAVVVADAQESNSSSTNAAVVVKAQENNSSSTTNADVVADAQENNSSNTSEDVPKVEEEKAVIEEPLAESSGHKKYEFDLNEPYVMED